VYKRQALKTPVALNTPVAWKNPVALFYTTYKAFIGGSTHGC